MKSDEKQQSTPAPRIMAFDLARGLAILFMLIVHVMETYGSPDITDSVAGFVIDLFGGPPAAPVFMFLMGASFVFSRRATIGQGIRRGVRLLLLAYGLNLLRGSVPLWIGLRTGAISLQKVAPYTPSSMFWIVDILQCAGLALILLSIIRRLLPWPVGWLLAAGAVAIVSPLLWGRMSGWPVLDWFLTLLWGTGDQVAFPIFPWFSYALVGLAFGSRIAQSSNRDRVFKHAALAGGILLIAGTVVALTNPEFHVGDYWRSGPGVIAALAGFALLWLAACHWLVKQIPEHAVLSLLYFWSRHVTRFYVFHWIIIGWGVLLFGFQTQGWPLLLFLMVGAAFLTDLCVRGWQRLIPSVVQRVPPILTGYPNTILPNTPSRQREKLSSR